MGKPRNTRKYPTYPEIPEIPESKKDTWKYPIVYFNTPTRPEPDPLPGIFSNTRPDLILKNPTRWALHMTLKVSATQFLRNRSGGLLMQFAWQNYVLKKQKSSDTYKEKVMVCLKGSSNHQRMNPRTVGW